MSVNLNYCSKCSYFKFITFYADSPNTMICFGIEEFVRTYANCVIATVNQDTTKFFSSIFQYPSRCPYALEQAISTDEENNKSLESFYSEYQRKNPT